METGVLPLELPPYRCSLVQWPRGESNPHALSGNRLSNGRVCHSATKPSMALGGVEPPRPLGPPLLRRRRLPSSVTGPSIASEGFEPSILSDTRFKRAASPLRHEAEEESVRCRERASDACRLISLSMSLPSYGQRDSNPQRGQAPTTFEVAASPVAPCPLNPQKKPRWPFGPPGLHILKNTRSLGGHLLGQIREQPWA